MGWGKTRQRLIEYGINAKRLPEAWRPSIDLSGAYLGRADLRSAYLNCAILSDAYLSHADLGGAHLGSANLSGAILNSADLSGANLVGANLTRANLTRANLTSANLHGADLSGIKTNYLTTGIHEAPEGALIGWGMKSGHLVKMLIPADAPRSCSTTRKYRASWVETLEIDGGVTRLEHQTDYGIVAYEIGAITRADSWDEYRWNECSHGIHFFLTREEAEAWD